MIKFKKFSAVIFRGCLIWASYSDIVKQEIKENKMKIFGDPDLGKEIVDVLHEWDRAIAGLDIQNALKLCAPELSFFDLSTEIHDKQAYEDKWNFYMPFMLNGVTVQRHNVSIFVESSLAFVYGYVKLTIFDTQDEPPIRWCRSTLCLRKDSAGWKMVHQHISVPVEIETQAMKVLEIGV
ncbi:nuclear transport factor 2 family protein [Acinetobacter thermotolerans]|uniref:YybH family protein n=1 Tax=Acinetobacter thermotolerans TaxID=3151487 RepID=UPI00325A8FB0